MPWSSRFIRPMRTMVVSKSKPWKVRWLEELPLPLVGELVAGEAALEAVLVGVALLGARVPGQDVLVGPQEEAAGAAGGVADLVAQLGVHEGARSSG